MTENKNTVKIETYKKIDIFYHNKENVFFIVLGGHEIRNTFVYMLKDAIDNKIVKEINEVMFKSDISGEIHKVKVSHCNKRGEYFFTDICDKCFSKGRKSTCEKHHLYPNSEYNKKIYNNFLKINDKIAELRNESYLESEKLKK